MVSGDEPVTLCSVPTRDYAVNKEFGHWQNGNCIEEFHWVSLGSVICNSTTNAGQVCELGTRSSGSRCCLEKTFIER